MLLPILIFMLLRPEYFESSRNPPIMEKGTEIRINHNIRPLIAEFIRKLNASIDILLAKYSKINEKTKVMEAIRLCTKTAYNFELSDDKKIEDCTMFGRNIFMNKALNFSEEYIHQAMENKRNMSQINATTFHLYIYTSVYFLKEFNTMPKIMQNAIAMAIFESNTNMMNESNCFEYKMSELEKIKILAKYTSIFDKIDEKQEWLLEKIIGIKTEDPEEARKMAEEVLAAA